MSAFFLLPGRFGRKCHNYNIIMKEYDFSKGKRNPYAKQLKKQVTINLSEEAILYFKEQSKETGIPYQTLINLYLT